MQFSIVNKSTALLRKSTVSLESNCVERRLQATIGWAAEEG